MSVVHYGCHVIVASASLCRMLPNAEHSCAGHYTSLIFSVRAFYLSILTVRYHWLKYC